MFWHINYCAPFVDHSAEENERETRQPARSERPETTTRVRAGDLDRGGKRIYILFSSFVVDSPFTRFTRSRIEMRIKRILFEIKRMYN